MTGDSTAGCDSGSCRGGVFRGKDPVSFRALRGAAGQVDCSAELPLVVPPRATGRVTWVNVSRGRGFIEPDDRTGELAVGVADVLVETTLAAGMLVEFDVVGGATGRRRATNVGARSRASITTNSPGAR